jgi:hypothetical protein
MQRSISGRAWDVVAGFELAYATTAGDQIRMPLVDAWSLRLESVPPALCPLTRRVEHAGLDVQDVDHAFGADDLGDAHSFST